MARVSEDGTPRTPALFSPCTRGEHREGESRGGASGTQLVVPDRGGSCNLRNRAQRKRKWIHPPRYNTASFLPFRHECRNSVAPRDFAATSSDVHGGMQIFLPSAIPRPVGGWASTRRNRGASTVSARLLHTKRRAYEIPPCSRGNPLETPANRLAAPRDHAPLGHVGDLRTQIIRPIVICKGR